MKFRQIALTDRKEQKIFKTYEKGKENKVIVYTDKVYCDENGLVLTENMCIINIDSTRLVFADRISKIIYDKENNYFNFLDQYGYSITMISSVRKRLLVEGEDHQIEITLEDEPVLQNYEYPIFTRNIEYVGDGQYLGKLYAQFSPITDKDKYLIASLQDSSKIYIDSRFNVLERDTFTNGLFNYLGLSLGFTILIVDKEDKTVSDICILYRLEDNTIKLIDKDSKEINIYYTDIINYQNIPYTLFTIGDDTLVYNKSDNFLDKNIENKEEVISDLSKIDKVDIEAISIGCEIMRTFINEYSDKEIDKNTKDDMLLKTGVYLVSYENISSLSIFDDYEGVLYIDENNNMYMILFDEVRELKNVIDKTLELLN